MAGQKSKDTPSGRLTRELEAIREGLPHSAPPPPGVDVPVWMKDGIEGLPEFFDAAAGLWDARFGDEAGSPFLAAVAAPIAPTDAEVRVLDIGCGTGLELPAIFDRAPRARITGMDVAPRMLEALKRKFAQRMGQITLVAGCCLDVPFGEREFDYVLSRLTMHHFAIAAKLELYRRIRAALKPEGRYIEGDQSSSRAAEQLILRWYDSYVAHLPGGDRGRWNFDVTLSAATQRRLLHDAGFSGVDLVSEHRDRDGNGWAVFSAHP